MTGAARPATADPRTATTPGGEGWKRYYLDRGFRMGTTVPARELSAREARAAGRRVAPALAALSASASGAERPSPWRCRRPEPR